MSRIAYGTEFVIARRMATVKIYRDLEAWRQAMDLVEDCYRITGGFPTDERFGLTSQMRRAAISVPANVAEGSCRRTTAAYINHVSIALGSHAELETCFEIADRLGYISALQKHTFRAECDSVGRLLNGLLRALEKRSRGDTNP